MKWQKRSFAILFALLVGFSCFSPAFVTKAWAASDGSGGTGIQLFVNQKGAITPTSSGTTFTSSAPFDPVNIPVNSTYRLGRYTVSGSAGISSVYYTVHSNAFPPVDHDRWVYFSYFLWPFGSYDAAGNYNFSVKYSNYNSSTLWNETGKLVNYITFTGPDNSKCYAPVFEVKLPAQCTFFDADLSNCKFTHTKNVGVQHIDLICTGAWLWDNQSQADMFKQVLTYLQSIDSELDTQTNLLNIIGNQLRTINTTTTSIYDLLKDTLTAEGAELSQESKNVANKIMQQDDAEQYWSDTNTENYQAIGLDSFSFSSSLISGFGVVGAVFQNIWDALGDASIVYTFPLILGVALVVIGRVARSGGKGKDKGGGKDG